MRVDSELILASLQGMNDNGDPALPIHDALVAPVRCLQLYRLPYPGLRLERGL
jgi:hypothetical protein